MENSSEQGTSEKDMAESAFVEMVVKLQKRLSAMMPTRVDPAAAAAREWDDWSLAEAMHAAPEKKRMRTVATQVADGVMNFSEDGSPVSCFTVVVEHAGTRSGENPGVAPCPSGNPDVVPSHCGEVAAALPVSDGNQMMATEGAEHVEGPSGTAGMVGADQGAAQVTGEDVMSNGDVMAVPVPEQSMHEGHGGHAERVRGECREDHCEVSSTAIDE